MIRKSLYIFFVALAAATISAAAGVTSVQAGEELVTSDSCFAHIDSNLYLVGDVMPRYAEEISVGELDGSDFEVEIRYPEFKPLSAKELRAVRHLQESGVVQPDSTLDTHGVCVMPSPFPACGLNLEKYVSVSRNRGYLNVSFSPVIRHAGEWKRILSCQICVTKTRKSEGMMRKADSNTERWASESVLSTGKWAKIRVSREGIYQLSADDIKKMGFSDINTVKVYGYGGLLQDERLAFPAVNPLILQTNTPDDLVEVPTMMADDRILFWAEGTVRFTWNSAEQKYTYTPNHYSNYSYYFITEGEAPARVAVSDAGEEGFGSTSVVSTVPFATVYDNDTFSWYSGGRRLFDSHDFANGNNHSIRLATPGIDNAFASVTKLEVSVGAASTLSSTSFDVSANGTKVGKIDVRSYNNTDESAKVAVSTFSGLADLNADDTNVFTFQTNNGNHARLDYVLVSYRRTLEQSTSPYSFSPQQRSAVEMKISGASSNSHVWMIGQPGSPTSEIPAEYDEAAHQLVANAGTGMRRFVCFDGKQKFETPEYVGAVENQNLHGHEGIEYVVIIPASGKLTEQAQRLCKLHHDKEGMNCAVVRADQLYNEFSSGTPDANAYRRYLKMLYDRANGDESLMPRYCLLMGKSPWDNRFLSEAWSGKSTDDYLLAYEADHVMSSVGSVYSYVTDDFFAMLDDGEGTSLPTEKPDLALGRMVCVTAADAERLVDKVETYIENRDPGIWKNTIAVLADDGDSNRHMSDAESVVRTFNTYAPNLDVQKVYWDRYTWTSSSTGYTYPQGTARIKQLLTEGASVFDYSGHGSPNIISHYKLLQTPDFREAYSPHMPLWVLASCEIYPFDSEENNLAETSLYVANGGAIAFMCATRAVYATENVNMNKYYCSYLLSNGEDGKRNSMGEALRLAKNSLVSTSGSSGDKSINKLKYVLFGDPALRLTIPTGTVVIDSINGTSINAGNGLFTLSAGSVARFSGHVCQIGSNNLIDETFEGNVSAMVFDREETVTCKDNQKGGNPYVFKERAKSIYKGTTKAEAGRFTFNVTIPRDISYTNDCGRISLYAVTPDLSTEYNGFSQSFCLNGTAPQAEPDTIAPKVVAYINSIDNPDYTITDSNPILIADVSDESGINNMGISLGHDIELVLDDNTADYINLNSHFNYDFGSYQKGQIVYEMHGIERGSHTAQLRVWDNNNNVTRTEVHFIVRDANAEGGEEGYVTSTKNPATTDTRFITYFPADAEVEGLVTYEVYDTRGRCVFKNTISAAPESTSSSMTWDLCGNDHQPLPAGIYFYRALITTSKGLVATDAQKIIIVRQ